MTLLARTLDDLRLVTEYWPALADLRNPTTYAPRPAALIDLMQRAELDYQARQEREERDEDAPGSHKDAARPEILDLLEGITWTAAAIAEAVSRHVPSPWARPALPATNFADPRPSLTFALDHLPTLDPAKVRRLSPHIARMASDASRALYLAPDGQALKTVCPWCKGGLSGSYSLRVRLLPGDLVAIVCESDIVCEPPSRKVGTWLRGRPAWAFEDWRWLAKELHAADRRERMSA